MGKIIYKWGISNGHIRLPEGNWWLNGENHHYRRVIGRLPFYQSTNQTSVWGEIPPNNAPWEQNKNKTSFFNVKQEPCKLQIFVPT